jgi:peptidoglycan/xylan/chitin deacetylase (PgdA/CDA1 family)
MLMSLMFHHANSDKYSNSDYVLSNFFEYISTRYNVIYPNEYKKSIHRIEVSLVFDDAYYDFYYYVYPLLIKYNLKATLAVPVRYIVEKTKSSSIDRLSLKHDAMMTKFDHQNTPFCTWTEISEMVDSGNVEVASHGYNHVKLTNLKLSELLFELKTSKEIIEDRLDASCDTFVYPYGVYNKNVLQEVNKIYKYNIAIGGMYNFGILNDPIYRIYADDMEKGHEIFSFFNKIKYILRSFRFFYKK